MPSAPATPRAGVTRRLVGVLDTRLGHRFVVVLNVLVLLTATAPFVLWEGFGPAQFAQVDLGQAPDQLAMEPGTPLAVPQSAGGDGWQATDLPFDLSPTTVVTLVFSVGSKDLDPAEADRLRVHDAADRGGDGLTDTMMLVVADRATRQVALLSIPRDLWMHARGHRINATLNAAGLQAFVDDVSRASGLPIHHLVQMNFGAFARLVDAVGGVAVPVDRPLADVPAVLYVPEAGCWRFDGAAALAWSRSRHTLTRDGEAWVTDRSASDFGRIERQQQLLGAVWEQVRRPGTVGSIPDLLAVARDGLVVDEGLGVQQVRDLLAVFGDMAAGRVEGHTLPTTGQWIDGNAAQVLDPTRATEVLTRLRTWPPETRQSAPASTVRPEGRAAPTVLAAPMALALPTDSTCTMATAQPLPDPREPLWGVARSTGGTGTDGGGDAPDPPASGGDRPAPDGADEDPPASEDPSEDPASSDAPDETPSEPTPDDEAPSPSPSESDDDGFPLPLPGD